MFYKFCKKEHNIAKGCSTVFLGSLQLYADDDPNFLRCDFNEGSIKIVNEGKKLTLDQDQLESISSSQVLGTGIEVAEGGNITIHRQLQNCYIYCLSENLTPSIEKAQSLDPTYNDWFCIDNIDNFIDSTVGQLMKQLSLGDLEIDSSKTIDSLQNCSIKVIHRPVSYEGRGKTITQKNFGEMMNVIENPIDWVFTKEKEHNSLNEYRIVFIVCDRNGVPFEVKKSGKLVNLMPDMGVSKIPDSRE